MGRIKCTELALDLFCKSFPYQNEWYIGSMEQCYLAYYLIHCMDLNSTKASSKFAYNGLSFAYFNAPFIGELILSMN